MKITLAEDTISQDELNNLCTWIQAGNRLTKAEETLRFEERFKDYIGSDYAIYTNSGSSANLMMIYGLKEAGLLKNNKVIAPAVSWVTTVSPLMQLGFDISLCECDRNDLGLDIAEFERLCKEQEPAFAILVHVLGHANQMQEIQAICDKYDVILIEDACEALGSEALGKKLGNLSEAASFSFYYGHHISTIEGGMVTTSNRELYHVMLSLRSHGWSRDLPTEERQRLTDKYQVDEFRNLYTFYHPGFNLRSTDLQAFIGCGQVDKIPAITETRERNFKLYKERLSGFFCQTSHSEVISSFAYGTLVKNRMEVFEHLRKNNIESRPLICGNIGRHPFWTKLYGQSQLSVANYIHDYGMYLPNHHNLSETDVHYVCDNFLAVAQPIAQV
ncbi:MAG: DegT/DnrJ/EryC1/StrS family aminotransferase [Coraliomargarita sp.]